MSEKYNGWTNYETWLTGLWWNDYFSNTISDIDANTKVMDKWEMADWMKDTVEEFEPLPTGGLLADLSNAAFSRIDWHDLAEHVMDDQLEVVIEVVTDLITTDPSPENATQLDEWITEGDISGMTPQEIADEWDELSEEVQT